jgi:hypothetical protein
VNNRSNNVFVDIVVYSMIVGGILVMTRPGSQGPGLVTATTNGYAGIVKAATGG